MIMLFKLQKIDVRLDESAGWTKNIFHYCDIVNLNAGGNDIDSLLAAHLKIMNGTRFFNLATFCSPC
jgi:hypothetical protein